MLAAVANNKIQNASGSSKLRQVWDAKARALRLTQESAAHSLGFKSQTAVSQYLNGNIPLNVNAAIGFARLLEVGIDEVWEGDALESFSMLSSESIRDLALTRLNHEEQLQLAAELLNRRVSGEDEEPEKKG